MFNMDAIHRIYGTGNDEQLLVGAYNGLASLTTFIGDGGTRRPVKFPLSPVIIEELKSQLRKIIDAAPGTRTALIKNNYDPESKKFEKGTVLIVGKDDKQMIYLDIQDKGMSTAMRFYLTATKVFQVGSEEMTDPQRSAMETRAFVEVVLDKMLPSAIIGSRDATRMAASAKQFKNNKNKGGGPAQKKGTPTLDQLDENLFGE